MQPLAPETPRPSFAVKNQYIKDLSFESPNLPFYKTLKSPPSDGGSLGVKIAAIEQTTFEVALVISHVVKRAEAVGFIIEFIYAGIFDLRGFPPEHRDTTLHIEAPELLFPFAHKIMGNLLLTNGFPFLMSPTFNFVARYADELARAGQGDIRAASTANARPLIAAETGKH
jgi:preprotein translocase subunit SecB